MTYLERLKAEMDAKRAAWDDAYDAYVAYVARDAYDDAAAACAAYDAQLAYDDAYARYYAALAAQT